MLDINFYQFAHNLEKEILNGKKYSKLEILKLFDENKSEDPIVWNIETTNACNMHCIFCPRELRMTRRVSTMSLEDFTNVANQLKPHSPEDWNKWEKFVQKEYGIYDNEMSENHFFTYIIPRVIQLHGYGDPLLDKNLSLDVKVLKDRGLESYFSGNPSNINLEKTEDMMDAGLGYLKYSIESVDDEEQKRIRGLKTSFTKSYKDICKILDIKKDKGYDTTVLVTMIDIGKKNQKEEYKLLEEKFKDKDVYIYLKSEDTQHLRKDKHPNYSIHWNWDFCKHPWLTMTIKSNGEATSCMECYNNLNVFGNVKDNTLKEIWDGEKYKQFRKDHVYGNPLKQCINECDMKLVSDII